MSLVTDHQIRQERPGPHSGFLWLLDSSGLSLGEVKIQRNGGTASDAVHRPGWSSNHITNLPLQYYQLLNTHHNAADPNTEVKMKNEASY